MRLPGDLFVLRDSLVGAGKLNATFRNIGVCLIFPLGEGGRGIESITSSFNLPSP